MPKGIADQNSVSVTAYDANGNPSESSTNVASLYLPALGSLNWNFSTPTGIVGQPLTIQFSNGGTPYGIASGPASATINASTGLLTWTPALADLGTANFVVTANNNNGWGTIYASLSFPGYVAGAATAMTLTPADWTSAGFTLAVGNDGKLHVYLTGTTTDAVPPSAPATVMNVSITAPSSTAANLTFDSGNGSPIPAGGLTYGGAGGLIKTGSGVVTLSGPNSYQGGTMVDNGTLTVANSSALPDGTSLTIVAGATFVFDPSQSASNVLAAGLPVALGTSAPVVAAAVPANATARAASALLVKAGASIVPPAAKSSPRSMRFSMRTDPDFTRPSRWVLSGDPQPLWHGSR